MRVWRAPEPHSLLGSPEEKSTGAGDRGGGGDGGGSELGPRDEAPACPQPPGRPGELIGHPRGSGLVRPQRAALGGPAAALPARPRRAPGEEFAWLELRLSGRVAGAGADP